MSKKTKVTDLEESCANLRRRLDPSDPRSLARLSRKLVDLALLYQQQRFDAEDIIPTAHEATRILQNLTDQGFPDYELSSRAYRILAEVYAENTESRDKALRSAELFISTAERSKNKSQIQLSFHVNAWVREKIWVVSNKKPEEYKDLLEEALTFCDRSILYLKLEGRDIKKNKEAVEEAGSVDERMAGVQRLASGIAGNLGVKDRAMRYWRSAWHIANEKKIPEMKYELRLAQLDFSWLEDEEKKKIAYAVVDEAHVKKKGHALMELSQVLIFLGEYHQAYEKLLDCWSRYRQDLPRDDETILQSRLIFAYRLNSLCTKLEKSLPANEKRKVFENLGDLILEYDANSKALQRAAVAFYRHMLQLSKTPRERSVAHLSVARTYYDLEEYRQALQHFEKLLEFERAMKKTPAQLAETRRWIFQCKCKSKGKLASKTLLNQEFSELLADIPDELQMLKYNLYFHMGEAMKFFGDHKAEEFLKKADDVRGRRRCDSEDDLGSDAGTESPPEDGEIADAEILEKCEKELKRKNDAEYIAKRRNHRNSVGETDLHVAAREDNTARLKMLIANKYDVNAQDFGHWTPLHEAVSYGKLTHVKILLNAGARVDLVSKEGLSGNRVSGGLTPLMDIATKLNDDDVPIYIALDIAELLFESAPHFISMESSSKWTAVDFLKDSINRIEEENQSYKARAQNLLNRMEQELRKQGKEVRDVPPPLQQRRDEQRQRQPPRSRPRGKDGASVYKRAIDAVGRRRSGEPDLENDAYSSDVSDDLPSERSVHIQSGDCDDLDDVTPPPRRSFSPPRPSSSASASSRQRPFTQRTPRSRVDDFIENDMPSTSRKRKSRETVSQPTKRRGTQKNFEMDDMFDEGVENAPPMERDESPEIVIRNEKRRSSSRVDSPAAPPPSSPQQLAVSVVFVTNNGQTISGINAQMFQFSSTSKVSDVISRCKNALLLEHRNVDIYSTANIRLDPAISLDLLADGRNISLKCVVKKASAFDLFTGYNIEYKEETEILSKLQNISLEENTLDLSEVEADYCIHYVLRSLTESGSQLESLNLSFCDLLSTNGRLLSSALKQTRCFSAHATNVNDKFVEDMVESVDSFPLLVSLDLSENNISAKGVVRLLNLTPNLKKLILRGVDLKEAGAQFVDAVKGLPGLIHLDLQNTQMDLETLEAIFSECESLKSINVGSLDMNCAFSLNWLSNLDEFRASGTNITNWDSFIEWVSGGGIKRIDLSCTSFSIDLLEQMCESISGRVGLVLRLVKCPDIENSRKKLEENMIRMVQETGSVPLRLSLSPELDSLFRQNTSLASEFLTDSY